MKKQTLYSIIVVVGIMTLTSFTYHYQLVANAVVEKINGVEIYCYSVPTKPYDVIDTGITSVVMGRCDGFANRSAEKAAKKHADAVILHFENFKYEAIKFK